MKVKDVHNINKTKQYSFIPFPDNLYFAIFDSIRRSVLVTLNTAENQADKIISYILNLTLAQLTATRIFISFSVRQRVFRNI